MINIRNVSRGGLTKYEKAILKEYQKIIDKDGWMIDEAINSMIKIHKKADKRIEHKDSCFSVQLYALIMKVKYQIIFGLIVVSHVIITGVLFAIVIGAILRPYLDDNQRVFSNNRKMRAGILEDN